MNSTNIIKASINLFIIVCVIAAFVEDIWFNPKINETPATSTSENGMQAN